MARRRSYKMESLGPNMLQFWVQRSTVRTTSILRIDIETQNNSHLQSESK